MLRRPCLIAIIPLFILGVGAAPAAAQPLTGFVKSSDYMVQIDGSAASDADVYWSQSARSFLVVAKSLSTPVIVQPANQLVRGVPIMKLAGRGDGSIDILADAAFVAVGPLSVGAEGASFTLDGFRVTMAQKPPLLGWQDSAGIAAYNATYADRSAAYAPQSAVMSDLRTQGADVRLLVFFGSWCPFCQQKVPLAMKVAEGLAGSKVDVDFYGLARSNFSQDAQARKYKIKSVPTGVVLVDGKEVGRISSDGWVAPEATLNRILNR
ncbi:MAG: thioredoxin family protein [Acidobacteriota bacterium]|nr:thioredoxin family protein [Acidobacteriota bacterium]